MISRELGAAALGAYFLAAKVAFLPFEAAHAIVGNVAFPLFAQLRGDRARSTATFDRLLGMLTITLLPIYAIMFVLAPSLPAVLGGNGTHPCPRFESSRSVAFSQLSGTYSHRSCWGGDVRIRRSHWRWPAPECSACTMAPGSSFRRGWCRVGMGSRTRRRPDTGPLLAHTHA